MEANVLSKSNKVVVFLAGNEEYALPIETVLSIEKPDDVTVIPHFPEFVCGMAKIRSELMPLIEMNKVLYPEKKFLELPEQRWISIKTKVMTIGLVVQAAREILDLTDVPIKQIGLLGYEKTEYMQGVANIGNRLITIIDSQKFVSSLEGIRVTGIYVQSSIK